jgi:hypothetical protein
MQEQARKDLCRSSCHVFSAMSSSCSIREWSGAAASCYRAKGGSNRLKVEVGCKSEGRPRAKERNEKERERGKEIEVKADTLSLDRIVKGHKAVQYCG